MKRTPDAPATLNDLVEIQRKLRIFKNEMLNLEALVERHRVALSKRLDDQDQVIEALVEKICEKHEHPT